MARSRPGALAVASVACASIALAGRGAGMWGLGPMRTPATRLVANLERRVAEQPQSAHAHYLLGRVHGLAFALE